MAKNASDETSLSESGPRDGEGRGAGNPEDTRSAKVVLDKASNLAVVPKNVSFEGCCVEEGDGSLQPLMSIRRTTVGSRGTGDQSDSGRGSESSFRALQIIAGTGRFSRNSSVSSSSQGQSSAQEPSPSLSSSSASDSRGINLSGDLPAPHMTPASTTSSFGISPKSRQDEEDMRGPGRQPDEPPRNRRPKAISLILGDEEVQAEMDGDEEEDLGFSLDLQDSTGMKEFEGEEGWRGEKWEGLLDLAPSTSSVPSEQTILGSDRSSMQSIGIDFSTRKSSVEPEDLSPSKDSPVKSEKKKSRLGTAFILGADDLDDDDDYVSDEEDADDEGEDNETYFAMLDRRNQTSSRDRTGSPSSISPRSNHGSAWNQYPYQEEAETGVEALDELRIDFPLRANVNSRTVQDITPQDAPTYYGGTGMERNDSITNAADLAQAGFQRVDTGQMNIMCHQPRLQKVKKVGNYLLGDTLGEGSFGKVKEGMNSETLCRIAVKIFKVRLLRKKIPTVEKQIYSEIGHMQRLNHQNIIKLMDVVTRPEKEKLYLFMEYCIGSLEGMLKNAQAKRFPEWQAHNYFYQLMRGLQYIHALGVVHCDIKPGNLLLAVDETLKITDFGEAVEVDPYSGSDLCSVNQGTPTFQSPEVASGNVRVRGFPVDMWAAGVSLYNMCSGQYPFEGDTVLQLYENISTAPLTMPSGKTLSRDLRDLLFRILHKDPEQRATIEYVWKCDWMRGEPDQSGTRIPLPRRVPPSIPGTEDFHADSPAYLLFPYFERLYEKTAYDAEIELTGAEQRKISVWSCANLSIPRFPVSSSPVESILPQTPLTIQVPSDNDFAIVAGPHSAQSGLAGNRNTVFDDDDGSEDGLQFTVSVGGQKPSTSSSQLAAPVSGYHRVESTPGLMPERRSKLKKSLGESVASEDEPRKLGQRIFGASLSSSFASLVKRRESRDTVTSSEGWSAGSSRNSSVSAGQPTSSPARVGGFRNSLTNRLKLPRLPQRSSTTSQRISSSRQHGSIEEQLADEEQYQSSRSSPGPRAGNQEKCSIQ